MEYTIDFIVEKAIHHYKLPIPQISSLYIYYLDLFEPVLKTRSIVEQAIKEINSYDGEDYYGYIHDAKSAIINGIAATDAFKRFNAQDNPDFFVPKGKPKFSQLTDRYQFTKRTDVYRPGNDGKYFISIDMEKANFQITRYYDKDMLFCAKTYEELVYKFVESKYFADSKYIRQIIFGQLASGRQNIMQKYYTGKILESIIDEGLLSEDSIRVYTHDELVFNADEYIDSSKKQAIKDMIKDKYGFTMHVDSFRLKHVWDSSYVKENDDGSIAFKGVQKVFYPQVYKKYFGKEITKKDLAFLHEGKTAYFESTIDGIKI